MDDTYHVYLDNTNSPETVPHIFKWVGPQNWYVVKAKDTEHAKSIVLNLFRHHGDRVMYVISKCLSATKTKAIYDHLKNPNVGLWSYIPHGNYRQPGQQANYPSVDEIAKTDREGHSVSRTYVPPKPLVPEGQNDANVELSNADLRAEDVAIVRGNKNQQMPQMSPNMTPDQMMAMMQQMMTMMQNGGQMPQQQNGDVTENDIPNSRSINQTDAQTQMELQEKMSKIMSPPRGSDPDDTDEIIGGDIDLSKIDEF